MKAWRWLGICLLLYPLAAFAQNPADEACKAFASLQIPQAARPTLQQARSAGRGCSAFGLYYSPEIQGHFGKARFCGLAQLGFFRTEAETAQAKAARAAGGESDGGWLPDALALAMLFANGEGVARNALAAKSLVCNFGFQSQQAAPTAMPALLHAIDAGERFELCGKDEGPQGRAYWYACASMKAGRAQQEIDAVQKQLDRSTEAPRLQLLHALEAAWKAFAAGEAKSFANNCGSGTGCGVFNAQHDYDVETDWLAQLKTIDSGQPPSSLPPITAYAAIDKQLNEDYNRAIEDARSMDGIASPPGAVPSHAQEQQLRETERCWLRYREAWVRFAAARWPIVQQVRWRAWLTEMRLNQLEGEGV